MPRLKTIAFFAENNTHTSTAYFHVYIFCEPLRKYGYNLQVYPILPDFLFGIWFRVRKGTSPIEKAVRRLFACVIIPLHRLWQVLVATLTGVNAYGMGRCLIQMHTRPTIEKMVGWLARRRGVPFIFFYPDALHLHHQDLYGQRFRATTHVIAVTPWLAQETSQLGCSSGCVRASIVAARYPLCNQSLTPVTIGFSGGPGNLDALLALEPVLREVAKLRPEARLQIIGNAPPPFKTEFPYKFRRWGNDDPFATPYEPGAEEMLDFQIGLAPITVDEYAMGKDSVKLRQYMALGLAIVGTDYGVNAEVLRNGENGILAKTEEQWVEAIVKLVDDPALRDQLGGWARSDVQRLFDVSVQAPLLAAELDKAIATAKTTAS